MRAQDLTNLRPRVSQHPHIRKCLYRLIGALGPGVKRNTDGGANEWVQWEVSKRSAVVLVDSSSCVQVRDLSIWELAPGEITELEPARFDRVVASASGALGECRFVRG